MGVFAIWAFVGFLYFKIAFDAAFTHADLSVIAALLMGGLLGFFVFIVSSKYFLKLHKYNANPKQHHASFWELFSITKWQFVASAFAYTIVARLIIFAFSKSLNGKIRFFRRDEISSEFILFVCLSILPLLVHYLITLWPTYQNCIQAAGSKQEIIPTDKPYAVEGSSSGALGESSNAYNIKQNADGSFQYKEFRYDKYEDALNYAKLKSNKITDKTNNIPIYGVFSETDHPPKIYSLTYDDVDRFLSHASDCINQGQVSFFTEGMQAAYSPIKQAVNENLGFGDTIHQYAQLTKEDPDKRLEALLPLKFKSTEVEAGFFFVVAYLALDYASMGIFPAKGEQSILRSLELNAKAIATLEKWTKHNKTTPKMSKAIAEKLTEKERESVRADFEEDEIPEHVKQVFKWVEENQKKYDKVHEVTIHNFVIDWDKWRGTFKVSVNGDPYERDFSFNCMTVTGKPEIYFPVKL